MPLGNTLYQRARQKMLNATTGIFITGVANSGGGLYRITTSSSVFADHGLQTNDVVAIIGVVGTGGMASGATQVNNVWPVTRVTATTFDLQGSTFTGAYTSGGEVVMPDATQRHNSQIIRWGVGSSGVSGYGDDIKAILVNCSAPDAAGVGTTYDVSRAGFTALDEFLSDVTGHTLGSGSPGPIIATSVNFTTKIFTTGAGATLVGGVAGADNVVFTSAGPASELVAGIIVYKDTGLAATSPLIMFCDIGTGLPVTLNGANVTVSWDPGSNRIFQV